MNIFYMPYNALTLQQTDHDIFLSVLSLEELD